MCICGGLLVLTITTYPLLNLPRLPNAAVGSIERSIAQRTPTYSGLKASDGDSRFWLGGSDSGFGQFGTWCWALAPQFVSQDAVQHWPTKSARDLVFVHLGSSTRKRTSWSPFLQRLIRRCYPRFIHNLQEVTYH